MANLGRIQNLIIVRESDHGFFLDGGDLGEILLPRREVPPEVEQGDEVPVFVSRDSEDRLVATTRLPLCEAGDYAGLRVVEVNRKLGAFLDWGLGKDLLLPFAEQSRPVREGETVVVRVLVDEKSKRLVATTKLGRYLDKTPPRYAPGEAVSLVVLERTPLGWSAMVERRHRGLLHANEVHRPLAPGDKLEGFVKGVKDEYKIDLALEPPGFSRVTDLSERILEALRAAGGRIELGDASPPEAIRERFGTSKKAFKAAVGGLYRKGLVAPEPERLSLLPKPIGKGPRPHR
jgi:predicted RNA-binding protein (virulence factor B family)